MASRVPSLRDLLFATAQDIAPGLNAYSEAGDSRQPAAAQPGPQELELLQRLLERGVPAYLTDIHGKFLVRNKAFEEIYTDDAFGDHVRNDVIAELQDHGHEITRHVTFGTGSGARHFHSRHFPIHDAQGHAIGFAGIFEDVSAFVRANRKAQETELWLHDIIRASSDWTWETDKNFKLTFISSRVSEALEEPTSSILGRSLFSIGKFDDQDPRSAGTETDLKNWVPFRSRKFMMTNRLGGTRQVLLSGVPVFDVISGAFRGYRGAAVDISTKELAEARLRAAIKQSEQTNAELRRKFEELQITLEHASSGGDTKFDSLAMMSHELKTPLNSIIGFSDAALQNIHGPIGGVYTTYFENIHKAGQHLLAIINDLLDSTSIDRKDATVHMRVEALQPLIEEAVAMAGYNSSKGTLDLSRLAVDTDLMAQCDRMRVRQILVNLIGNALKFTPDRGRIGIDVESRNDGLIAISVWDTGIGIPADEQELVFEKFYQVDRSAPVRGPSGTGLGLNISRRLARLMGGDLTVTSIPGKGSRFTLTLPAARGDD